MNKKIIGIVAAVAIMFVAAVAIRSIRGNEVDSGPIRIGQMSALTGEGSDIGVEEANGTRLAAEEINARGGIGGRMVRLVSEDTPPFDVKNGASIAEKLVSIDGVSAIIGPQ